eukprot:235906-Hanusia_phi.AAC.2
MLASVRALQADQQSRRGSSAERALDSQEALPEKSSQRADTPDDSGLSDAAPVNEVSEQERLRLWRQHEGRSDMRSGLDASTSCKR